MDHLNTIGSETERIRHVCARQTRRPQPSQDAQMGHPAQCLIATQSSSRSEDHGLWRVGTLFQLISAQAVRGQCSQSVWRSSRSPLQR